MKIKCSYSELLDITDPRIIPNPENPNDHSQAQIDQLSKILDYQGQRKPIIISNQSGFIVTGHGTLTAVHLLNAEKIAVDFQDFDTPAQEYAHVVADNAIALQSYLDKSKINESITMLGPDFNLDHLGFNEFTIDVNDHIEMDEVLKEDMNKKFIIEVTFINDMEMQDIHDDLVSRGYIVRIK